MVEDRRIRIKTGTTILHDAEKAVQELFENIRQDDMVVVIFFCSSTYYDLNNLGTVLKRVFTCNLIGCTTSGELSSCGYQEGGIVAASISSAELMFYPHLIHDLNAFDDHEARKLADLVRTELSVPGPLDRKKMFGFLMIDGLSMAEEFVIATLYHNFEGIPIIGGSAGDNIRLIETKVYYDGAFYSNAALFTVFKTTLPFHTFKTQHFIPTENKVVITGADASRRLVTEINAEPAALEYAGILGLKVTDLTQSTFSRYPLMLRIGNEWYVRSIQKVNHDNSLSFFSAIDVGLVLTIGESGDIIANLREAIDAIYNELAHPTLIIGCDCGLRRTEIVTKGLCKEMEALLKDVNIIGFNTYGEQYNSIHVNQTLTGVAIGG